MQRFIIIAVVVIAMSAVLNDAEAAPRRPSPKHTLDVCPVMCESAATANASTASSTFSTKISSDSKVTESETAGTVPAGITEKLPNENWSNDGVKSSQTTE